MDETDRPKAFLSYTRIDDEFFGGAITKLRRLLELGVQVVTGDRAFTIFQDIDGIELGQKWEKRINEAILTSTFLIPIVTPLFFTSDACRDELNRFVEHERSLGRDDLILPIYFQEAAVLEKPELLKDDPLANEIASHQRYDWRVQADLPADDPQIRRAVRELAKNIAAAIARTTTSVPRAAQPRPVDDRRAAEEISELVRSLGQERQAAKSRKLVLWVDDNPDNNIYERRSMAAYNIDFVLALSTGQALAHLRKQEFDAIISDMGRPPDPRAGYTLLEALRDSGDQTPYFIYAGSRDPEHVREALRRGAQGTTNRPDELLQMMLQTVSRDSGTQYFSQTPAESRPENFVSVAEVKSARHEAEQRAPDAPAIFISYMREDAEAARRLRDAITGLGGDVWLDERRLRPGDAWDTDILTAIRRTVRLFVPIISANTERAEEGYLFREWAVAVDRSLSIPHRRFIVPVIVDADSEGDPSRYRQIPDDFRRLHFGRAPAGDPDAELLAMLKDEIRALQRTDAP